MSYWGPSTWIFMHTLACKVHESSFEDISQSLLYQLIQISYNLPCPECAQHARQFWSKINVKKINTKQDLINMLFVFHNSVNKRKQLPAFKMEQLDIYNSKKLIDTYNIFHRHFHTRGNMQLLNDAFHRTIMLKKLKAWLMLNIQHFDTN